ncbi:hypothetical protein [Nocardia sp. NBC_01327]|uniref:hypothetical protein n=1 Tax=Nocardia sp. NBC_01327 TaxID=2903593 RepID=UPI002E148644|nr:hypothetical protein OG326_34665 [Nocardia sp. NBC_01327]
MRNLFAPNNDDHDGNDDSGLRISLTLMEFYVCYDEEIDSVMFGIRVGSERPVMMAMSPVQAMSLRDMFDAAIADAVTMPEGMA